MPTNTPTVVVEPSILTPARAARATRRSAVVTVASVIGSIILVTLAAQVGVPIPGTDVPMTLQLLAVLVTGFLLSPNHAVAALSAYLVLGSAGLPVFSPWSTGLWGPTGGYLVGFIPAAWLMGVLRGRGDVRKWRLLGAGTVGVAVVFVCGVGWRIAWLAGDWRMALQTGLIPFAIKAIVELCLAITLVMSVRRWHERRGGINVSECAG